MVKAKTIEIPVMPTFTDIIHAFILMVWLILPAALPNSAASVVSFFLKRTTPIDFGKSLGEQRILGDGKSCEGLLGGIIFGVILAIVQNYFSKFIGMPEFPFIVMFALPLGSLLGDIIASFFKRRLNIQRGKSLPLIDQLDFVLGAWLLTFIFAPEWFLTHYNLLIIILTLLLIPVFHLLFNIVGYKIGISREPW